MTVLLSKAGSKLTVKQLLDTLAETMEFEASVTKKNGVPVSHPLQLHTLPSNLYPVASGDITCNHPTKRQSPVEADHISIRATHGSIYRRTG